MTTVIVSISSAHLQPTHIQWASQWLATLLSGVTFSRVLWTADVNGSGQMYMNRLAIGTTSLPPDQLQSLLKAAEQRCGRCAGRITLDLDLMQYGAQRLHLHDWPRPYIQQLINDIL